MKKSELYNLVADMRNFETITAKEAEKLINTKKLAWYEFDKDEYGRETLFITASLRREENVNRTLIIA